MSLSIIFMNPSWSKHWLTDWQRCVSITASPNLRTYLCTSVSVQAFAERLHEKVRTCLWGYASDEHMDPSQMHKIAYMVSGVERSFPPLPCRTSTAPGYPSQPHSCVCVLTPLPRVPQGTPHSLDHSCVCVLTPPPPRVSGLPQGTPHSLTTLRSWPCGA